MDVGVVIVGSGECGLLYMVGEVFCVWVECVVCIDVVIG